MVDQRKFNRVPKEILVSYEVLSPDHQILEEGIAKSKNISAMGLLLELANKVNKDDRMKLTLNLDGELATIWATVIWCQPGTTNFEAGVKIDYVPREQPEIDLGQYLSSG